MNDQTAESAVKLVKRRPLKMNDRAALYDGAFRWSTLIVGLLPFLLIVWIGGQLYMQSSATRMEYGWTPLRDVVWDPAKQHIGALWFIIGTLICSSIALAIAVPIGVGAALFLAEVAPRKIANPIAFLIELLAAIPSVIYGLWGLFALVPWLSLNVYPWLQAHFGSMPAFSGAAYPTNMISAGLVLAIMILPFITAVSREVINQVPTALREASLGLGATRWEMIRTVVLRAARGGIIGAVILGLGRAVGETMAVVMVIGNSTTVTASLLQGGYTMPAVLANEFGEAMNDPLRRSALLEIALVLFVVTLVVNAVARLIISYTTKQLEGRSPIDQNSRLHRVLSAVRVGALSAVGLLLGYMVIRQIASDFTAHGVAGLFGPIEMAIALYIAIRGVTFYSRGKAMWEKWRKLNNVTMHGLLAVCATIACFVLGLLLVYVSVQGARSLNLPLFTKNEQEGGMLNGLIGTPVLVLIASLVGIPIGLMGGIFLAEFGKTRIGGAMRFGADVLNGIPSIVIGMFGYAAFVLPFSGKFSAIAGGLALGVMMIPTIMRTTEEIMRLIPDALRESSLGLGATRLRTVWSIILPAARGGIVTGILLAIARIAGETAPLLFTAFGNQMVSCKANEPITSLTMLIYRFGMAGDIVQQAQAWAGALLLLLFVLIVSIAARIFTRNRYALR